MHKKIISIILASAMLLSFASCSSKKAERRDSDRDSHKKHTEETEDPEESEETDSPDGINGIASYRDYLGLVEGYEYFIHGIENYYSDSCALADVTGDGIEDLIIMMQRCNNGWANEVPEILVYSYNSGRGVTSLILEENRGLGIYGGGGSYLLGVTNDGKLMIFESAHDDYSEYSYTVYRFDGNSLVVDMELAAEYPGSWVPDEEDSFTYNGIDITEAEFEAKEQELIGSITTLLQYSSHIDRDLHEDLVDRLYSTAMSYDVIHSYFSCEFPVDPDALDNNIETVTEFNHFVNSLYGLTVDDAVNTLSKALDTSAYTVTDPDGTGTLFFVEFDDLTDFTILGVRFDSIMLTCGYNGVSTISFTMNDSNEEMVTAAYEHLYDRISNAYGTKSDSDNSFTMVDTPVGSFYMYWSTGYFEKGVSNLIITLNKWT